MRRGARGRGTPRGPGREAGQTPPLSHNCLPPRRGRPAAIGGVGRAPDPAAPGAPGPGRSGGSWVLLLEDEPWALHRGVWARSRVFYTPTCTSLCGGAHACGPGATPRAGPQPPVPALQRAPPFQIETDKEEVAGCLEVAAGRVPGLLSAAPPSPCEEKGSWEVPGPGAGASSWGAREAWPLSVHCALAWV